MPFSLHIDLNFNFYLLSSEHKNTEFYLFFYFNKVYSEGIVAI